MTMLATTRTSLAHRVRLEHASTGATITAIRLATVAWTTGWSARVASGEVIVVRRESAGPAADHVDVVVTDGVLAEVLDLPAPLEGQEPRSVRVPLTDPEISVPIPPVPMVLTVVLTQQGAGGPSTGRTVTVRPSSGAAVPLSETAPGSGIYSSIPRVWGAEFIHADLRIGAITVRRVSPDFTRIESRIHAVDPT